MWPSAAPPAPAMPPPAVTAPAPLAGGRMLAADQIATWRRRITAALEASKPSIEDGKTNVARYMGKALDSRPTQDEAVVPTDFYYIEAKRAQLFYRLPDVFVKPEQPGTEDAAVVFQAALNKEIGPGGVNVLPTVQQVIFDLLCPTGFGAVAIGYQTIVDGTVPVPLGVGPDGQPTIGQAPNITACWYFIEHIRPGDLLVAPEFAGLDFDKAPWLGQRFREDVPDDEPSGKTDSDERRLLPLHAGADASQRKQRTGYEVWYRAHLFDADVKHPDKIRMFKLYDDDRNTPVEVKDHPHQRYANAAGQLKSGMKGYPISPVTLRYISDTWMPPSDCTMARNTADELSRGRTQMLRSRDRHLPQWGYNAQVVDKDIQGKIERNEIAGGIPFNGPGADATWPIIKGDAPRETYQFNDVAQVDLDRIWRLPPNSRGELDSKNRTATEQQIAASSAQDAHEADRAIILSWYVNKVVTKFASLLQLYATQTQYVELIGADAQRLVKVDPAVQQQAQATGQDARALVPWNADMIQGRFTFSVKPNSQVFVDAAQDRKQLMDLYQFFANEPTVNRAELTRAILTRYGFDPSKLMQQAPPRQAPPPTMSLSFSGQDLSPLSPQSPIVLDLLAKQGEPIDPATVTTAIQHAALLPPQPVKGGQPAGAVAEQTHGGAVQQAEPLSKHQTDLTGGMQGSGQPAPLGAGGTR